MPPAPLPQANGQFHPAHIARYRALDPSGPAAAASGKKRRTAYSNIWTRRASLPTLGPERPVRSSLGLKISNDPKRRKVGATLVTIWGGGGVGWGQPREGSFVQELGRKRRSGRKGGTHEVVSAQSLSLTSVVEDTPQLHSRPLNVMLLRILEYNGEFKD